MTGIPDELVTELRLLLSEATQGTWFQEPDTMAGRVWVRVGQKFWPKADIEPLFQVRNDNTYEQRAKDAALIVAVVNALPALLERVEAADSRPADLAHDCAENEHDCAGKAEYGACDEGPDETVVCACSCHLADRDALAAKVADAGERIAQAIEKANRKVIDARVADINAKPHIVDRAMTYAAQIARTALTGGCPTPGCEGDVRYAAPGRGHSETCHFPLTEGAE